MLIAIREFLKSHKELKSIRLLIFVVITLIGIVFSTVLRNSFINSYENRLIEKEEQDILEEMQVLAGHMIARNYLNTAREEVVDAELSVLADLYHGQVFVIDSDYRIIRDSENSHVGSYVSKEQLSDCFNGLSISGIDDAKEYIHVGVPVEEYSLADNSSRVIGVIYGLIPVDSIYTEVENMNRHMWTIQAVMLIAIVGIGLIVAALISRPLIKLTKAIESVASFEEGAISVSGYQETEGIAIAFNAQRNRLKTLDDSRQEFVSNVSHELRTPITSIKVLADTLILQEDAPLEMYKDFMKDIVEEIDRENSIITDLLELVNMEKGKDGLKLEKTDVNNMIELIIKRLTPIADLSDIEISLDSSRTISAEVDEVKMTLALTNLVENAIKYNVPHGFVRIALSVEHQILTISIVDSGVGIPEEALPRIFERFYRVDKSHSKEIGGTGLGLSISRKIILLHRGSVTVDSKVGVGTTFTVKLPVSHS